LKRDFDSEAKSWDQNEGRVKAAIAIADAMRERLELREHQTLMDFGTGTGLVALRLLSHVGRVVAVDTSKGMLEVLGRKIDEAGITNIVPMLWDEEQGRTELPKADVIVSAMTLHHIADIDSIAAMFFGALAPGGQIAIADLDLDGGEFHADPMGVEHNGFDREELKNKFVDAGFSSVQVTDAHTLRRTAKDGTEKEFTVFLLTGRK
jgi:cyclopropane fatty-acyl-phospholipid synthase-like methyltransferase